VIKRSFVKGLASRSPVGIVGFEYEDFPMDAPVNSEITWGTRDRVRRLQRQRFR
jgi:hypothetical protein